MPAAGASHYHSGTRAAAVNGSAAPAAAAPRSCQRWRDGVMAWRDGVMAWRDGVMAWRAGVLACSSVSMIVSRLHVKQAMNIALVVGKPASKLDERPWPLKRAPTMTPRRAGASLTAAASVGPWPDRTCAAAAAPTAGGWRRVGRGDEAMG